MNPASRSERFVRTAKKLLAAQVVAAAGVAALGAWAAVEVSGVVTERDALRAQVAALEAQRTPDSAAPVDEAEPAQEALPEAAAVSAATNVSEAVRLPPPDETDKAGPPTLTACRLLDGTGSECALPLRRAGRDICLDVRDRPARCPDAAAEEEPSPPPPPVEERTMRARESAARPLFELRGRA